MPRRTTVSSGEHLVRAALARADDQAVALVGEGNGDYADVSEGRHFDGPARPPSVVAHPEVIVTIEDDRRNRPGQRSAKSRNSRSAIPVPSPQAPGTRVPAVMAYVLTCLGVHPQFAPAARDIQYSGPRGVAHL